MKILKYLPTHGAPINAEKAEIYGRELHRLASLNGGAGLTPDVIVNEARNVKSPLREWFQWDKDKAAENWWKQQARMLCNSISVEVTMPDGGTQILPMLESITVVVQNTDGDNVGSERRYVTVRMLEKEEAARVSVTNDAVDRLSAALQTIENVARLGNGRIDATLSKVIAILRTYISKQKQVA